MAGLAGAASANAENPNINPSPSMTDFVVFSIFNLSALKSLAHFVGIVGTSMAVSSTTVKGWIGAHSGATISRYRELHWCLAVDAPGLMEGLINGDRRGRETSISVHATEATNFRRVAIDRATLPACRLGIVIEAGSTKWRSVPSASNTRWIQKPSCQASWKQWSGSTARCVLRLPVEFSKTFQHAGDACLQGRVFVG